MKTKKQVYFIKKANANILTTTPINYDSFETYLQSKNIWQTTIKRYVLEVQKAEKWFKLNKSKSLEQTEKKDILDYLQYLQESLNYSSSSRSKVVGILKHYYTFLYQNKQIANNPALLVKIRGTKKRMLNKLLSLDEMNEFLDTHFELKIRQATQLDKLGRPKNTTHIHQRNHLILSLCIYQGLNRSEWANIKLSDIDMQQATLKINQGRKTNARNLPLQATQIGILYEYLNNTRNKFPNESELLINSNPELQKLQTSLRKIYPKFTDFKQLRASIITYWIKTKGLRKAQYMAGHRYISSTEEYLWNNLVSLKNDINNFHPL